MVTLTSNSISVASEIAKCWAFLIAIQIYYEILVYRPPYREQVLFKAEKYCVHSYRIVLIAIILKHINGSEGLGIACDIVHSSRRVVLEPIFFSTSRNSTWTK
mgnify:CR=1 FL=1